MIFSELIKEDKEAIEKEISAICKRLLIPIPEWLIFCMWFETVKTLDPKKVNYQKGDNLDPSVRCMKRAVGLIQFMPSTARTLGTTNQRLYNMSFIEQLRFVELYLSVYKGRFKSFDDLYLAIFYPAAIGKDDSYKIGKEQVAKQNPIFDLDKNGQITKGEVRKRLFSMIPNELKHYF